MHTELAGRRAARLLSHHMRQLVRQETKTGWLRVNTGRSQGFDPETKNSEPLASSLGHSRGPPRPPGERAWSISGSRRPCPQGQHPREVLREPQTETNITSAVLRELHGDADPVAKNSENRWRSQTASRDSPSSAPRPTIGARRTSRARGIPKPGNLRRARSSHPVGPGGSPGYPSGGARASHRARPRRPVEEPLPFR
jgi:hypothetical protein